MRGLVNALDAASDLPTDEARRALALELAQIADRVERSRCGLGVNERHVIDLGLTVAENLPTILASLRAKTAGGAGEMRERCAKLIEGTQEWRSLTTNKTGLAERAEGNLIGFAYAAAIRSLPLDPSPQAEGGGETTP